MWASESSVRRDVKALENKNCLKQIYGGVVYPRFENSVVPVALRDHYNSSVKEELAKQASKYFYDGATVFMDGSSTIRRIIKYINNFHRIKIITNKQQVFNEAISPEISLYCTGGRFLSEDKIFVGSIAEKLVKDIHAGLMFFSSQGISVTGEITDASEEETALRQAM